MHTYKSATHVALTQEKEDHSLLWALLVSMLLHIAIAYVYPQFKSQSILPQRTTIQVQLNQLPEQSTPAATQPPAPPTVEPMVQPKPPKPTPPTPVTKRPKTKTERPVLATPTPEQSYQVPVEQTDETPTVTAEAFPQKPQPTNTPIITSAASTPANTELTKTEQTAISTAQPVIVKSSEEASSDEVWDGYGKVLAAMVNKLKQYPTIAIRRHLEGEVKVIASFKQGKLISIELAQASQHQVLNEEAMRTIKKAIEQVALHANLERKTFTVTIPIGFKLE
jgi:periplasmic protein TonB